MKILVVGDLHGAIPKIPQIDFDAIIAVGDFCSGKGIREVAFRKIKEELEAKKQGKKYTKQWYDLIGKREAKKMIQGALSKGRKVLEYLNSFGVPVYVVPGNGDWYDNKRGDWGFVAKNHYVGLIEGLSNIVDVHNKVVNIGDYQIIGYGVCSAPEYPQEEDILKEYDDEKLREKKKEFELQLKKTLGLFDKSKKPVIFLSHNSPYGTKLDKINNPGSPRNGKHFGSIVTKNIIEKYSPLICICGHIHENLGKEKIGETLAFNAGFGEEAVHLLELDGDKININLNIK